MKYKNIIFDLDGVLVSTDEYHYQAWKKIADEEGIYFDREINNKLRGVSRMASLEIILEKSSRKYSDEEKSKLAERKNDYYKKLLENLKESDTLPGVRDTLANLKNQGVRLAVGSSSKNMLTILDKIGLTDEFDAIADGREITHSKPDPEVFLLAAKKLGAAPADCLVVEDATAGIEAGHSAGMDTAGIGEAALSPLATYSIKQISELMDLPRTHLNKSK